MKSSAFANDILRLIFHGDPIAGLAKNASLPIANLFVSLHSAQPVSGQGDNEARYARQQVSRSAMGWAIAGSACKNAEVIEFGEGDGGAITHVGVGTQPTGAGKLIYSGALNPPMRIAAGYLPRFAAGEIVITEETLK